MLKYHYDLETFSTCFLFVGKFDGAKETQVFEISTRKNQRNELLSWLSYLQNAQAYMVGFNSLGFDNPIIEELINNPYMFTFSKAYQMGQDIIHSQGRPGFGSMMRPSDRTIPQIDLYRINHFDNKAKTTSLKALQCAMRLESVEDLPYDPHTPLTSEQMDNLISYGLNDLLATESFAQKCDHHIKIRKEILDQGILRGDVLNYSDVKIGTEYFVSKIGRSKCFVSGSKPNQTLRPSVKFEQIILPKISFRSEPFEAVLDWFKQQTIWINRDENPKLEVSLAGLQFYFGLGGVHASVENRVYESTETHVIKDIDVSGMYVAVAIANGFFPEHLGQEFVTVYRQLQKDRAQYKKGTTMNLILKLAGNGVYGNSNNSYSPFYDPKYTYSVTANGQLQLLQLVEVLSLIPSLEIIQANTDGITVLVPRGVLYLFDLWKSDWEAQTNLKLEEVEYSKMMIRDVNNYIAVSTDGKVKRKGAYAYPVKDEDYWGGSGSEWHKDFSNLASRKGVEQVMLTGVSADNVVRVLPDKFDFMLRYKTQGGARVYIGDKQMSKTVRYYVSTSGEPMKKISKPKGEIGSFKRKNSLSDAFYQKILSEIPAGTWDARIHTGNKSKVVETSQAIESGWLVKECNKASNFNWSDVDYRYYAKEIEKLVIGKQK